ncbi:MAG: hypothetical protein R3C14_44935 [Caldilineaceae bacterium]
MPRLRAPGADNDENRCYWLVVAGASLRLRANSFQPTASSY